jgi:hypothetical protein
MIFNVRKIDLLELLAGSLMVAVSVLMMFLDFAVKFYQLTSSTATYLLL